MTTKTPKPLYGLRTPAPLERRSRQRRFSLAQARKSRLFIPIIVALLVASCLGGWLLWQHQAPADDNDGHVAINAVSRHYLLPTNEQPAVATVTDQAKLTSALKGKAINGDKLLVYKRNHLAILYRPKIDKLVMVSPITIDTPKDGSN